MTEKNIYQKLAAAKAEMGKLSKDSKNPYFKSNYLSLNGLLHHVEPLLEKHGLLLLQPIVDGKVSTSIIEVGKGETVISEIELPNITDPQKLGSAITYYRRYTLQSLLGLQAEDDDGNVASKAPIKPTFTAAIAKAEAAKGTPLEQLIKKFDLTIEQQDKYKGFVS